MSNINFADKRSLGLNGLLLVGPTPSGCSLALSGGGGYKKHLYLTTKDSQEPLEEEL